MLGAFVFLILGGSLFCPAQAPAAAEVKPVVVAPANAPAPISAGDTAWMLTSAALVLLMTPGLACFYGGLVRRKNVLGTMMQSMAAMSMVGVLWAVAGYSLAFGPDHGHLIGDLKYFLLGGVDGAPHPVYANTVPHLVFAAYQGMFAIITPALIGGAVAERMKFSSFFWFITIWSLVVYAPLAHWVWGDGGWLARMGALDFAGGTVVHISSGFSALVACLMLGRRRDFPREPIIPHNLPLVVIGGGLLWFGWFGFNAGSASAANGLAANAFMTTQLSAAAAALTWMFHDWIRFGKPTALGTVSGAVAGLVGITPAAGFVTPASAIVIGAVTSLGCANFVHWRTRRGIDDSLDAFGVHGIGGTIGALLTGVFAVRVVNDVFKGGPVGLIDGHAGQVLVQAVGVLATYAYAGLLTFAILSFLKLFGGIRLTQEQEVNGLDQSQHGEEGYSF